MNNDESANRQTDQTGQGLDEPVQGGVAQPQTIVGASALDGVGGVATDGRGGIWSADGDGPMTGGNDGMQTAGGAGTQQVDAFGGTEADVPETNVPETSAPAPEAQTAAGMRVIEPLGQATEAAEDTEKVVDVAERDGKPAEDAKVVETIDGKKAAKALKGKTPQEIDDEIMDKFLYGLMEAKGLKSFEGEIRWVVKEDLKKLLVEYINLSIFNALPKDKLDVLEQAVDEGDKEKIGEIFKGAGVDYGKVVGEALIGFGNTYLGEGDGGTDGART